MDVEKILEMLEKEDVPFNIFKRPQVAKESLVSACNGDYDAINRLLEEDIAIDERVYDTRPVKRFSKSSKESIGGVAKEDSTPIGVDNPIPSPVRKKADEETLSDKMIRALDSGSATESTTEKSPMKGSTDDIVKNKPINFKSQNNKFETQKAPETGKACAMTEKQTQKAAGEELISTKEDSIFPEELDFDTAAFAELFGLDEDDVSAMYVEEEDNIPEHIEIRFKEGDNEVLLQLMDDGSLIEEVNAEIVEDPRFSASIEQDDEGKYILLVSDATDTVDEADDVVKSEEDSEGLDEEGLDRTEEFVEGAGLDLDSEYANTHDIKPAKDATTKIKDPTQLPVNK